MSSRILRRFQGKDAFLETFPDEESEGEPDLTVRGTPRQKNQNVNPFDLLNNETQSDPENVEDEEENDGEAAAYIENTSQEDTQQSKKKKKKKKKRRKSEKSSPVLESAEETLNEVEINEDLNDLPGCSYEIPQLPSLNFPKSPQRQKCWRDFQEMMKKDSPTSSPLLSIRGRNLNATNEMKKMFGSKIVEGNRKIKRDRGKGFVRHYLFLSGPKETWPPLSRKGLSMRMDRSEAGQSFAFQHNQSYQQVQRKFLAAVESLNPDNIMVIINEHPYHVDALLQLSDLCKMSEDLQMAADLNERALYCLESAFHPLFNIIRGDCILDYHRQENRPFFICLFRHMLFVGQRACYETALEICKALLVIDFESDPLAVLLCIDFYALRSHNYGWLISAAMEWEVTKLVSHLPNWAYSLALAYFYTDGPESKDQSDILLQTALIAFPSVLRPLLELCSIQIDQRVAAHPYFTTQAINGASKALGLLVLLYVHRTYHEWKVPEVLPWLEKNVHKVLDRVDAGDPVVDEWAKRREYRYSFAPKNVLRHIILSDIKEVHSAIVGEVRTPIMSFDPLPPVDSIDLYHRPSGRSRLAQDSNALSVFFRSLLPNFNVNELAPPQQLDDVVQLAIEADPGGADGGVEAVGDTLRVSVAVLMDAIGAVLAHMGERRGNDDEDNDDENDDINEDGYGEGSENVRPELNEQSGGREQNSDDGEQNSGDHEQNLGASPEPEPDSATHPRPA